MTTTTDESDIAERAARDFRLMEMTNQRVASGGYAGWLAGIRLGITPAGEPRALAQAGPYVVDMDEWKRRGALRAAAIRAVNKDVRHSKGARLGHALAILKAKDGGSSIEQQVSALPLMNRDAAALVLDGLIGRFARSGIAVDFTDLAGALIYWGNGSGSHAASRRNRIVLDFYTGPTKQNARSTSKPTEQEA